MQAVILAAGQSSRFYPFTGFPHKSCAPLLGKPLFVHTLESVKKAGITDVVIITGKDNFIEREVGNGSKVGLRISYITQSSPQGMGDALLQARDILENSFFVLHAHHVEFHEVAKQMEDMGENGETVLLAREEEHVEQFGVLQLKNERVIGIVEKPAFGKEPSHLRVIGIYLLNRKFVEVLQVEKPDHYNFESALSAYAKEHPVAYVATDKNIISLKFPWDILAINKQLLHMAEPSIAESAKVSKGAVLSGKVIIDEEASIMEGAVIKGPCYIGKRTKIGTNAIVRDSVTTGEDCTIGAFLEIKNSVLFNHTSTHSGYIGDSVIGSNNKIAAFFSSANVRLDRKNVKVETVRGEIDSGVRDLGVMMGDNNKIGIRVTTMPGTIIGNDVTVGPSTTVLKNIPDGVTYYTKFREVVESTDGALKPSDDTILNTKNVVLFDIDYTLFDTGTFKESQLATYALYDEVIEMLVSVSKVARLGIFSEGELDFQKTKLLKTDILRHFLEEHIHIVGSKDETIGEVLKRYTDEAVFLVDDKLPVLVAAKKILRNVKTIWVKRGIYAENQKPIAGFTPDYEVTSLTDIATIVEQNS